MELCWLSTDPLEPEYPWNSPYAFSENRVIDMVELEGLETADTKDKKDSKSNGTFLDGWNEKVGNFNANFNNGVNEFLNKPVETAITGTLNFLNNSALLVGDCIPGLTQAMGIENKTGNAIASGIGTLLDTPNMSNKQLGSLAAGATIFASEIAITEKLPIVEVAEFQVGEYATLAKSAKGSGLDAHHVGQSKIMQKLVPEFDHATAPAILVSKFGHRKIKPGLGIVNRSTKEIMNVRSLIARDALELRRVYKVPNERLIELIQMNKTKYPKHFIKPRR
jgi:hypothetical protein